MRALCRVLFFFSSRRRHTRFDCDWSSDVCSSDLCSKSAPACGWRPCSSSRSWSGRRASDRSPHRMIALGIIALATLAANGSRQLRYSAVALLGVSLAANVLTAGQLTVTQLALEGAGALVACGVLYVAARDRTYGEDPGWRLWVATIVAAAATAACFATLRTASSETVSVPLIGEDPSGVTAQVAAFWLISSGERNADRSEEHTSELQSQSNLVCRLLLEKIKKY